MNFNFKKIASIASSTLLIGSTVALAAAANYPAPFVSGSNADVAIVVGANAAPTDTTAAQADIYSHLATVFAANGGTTPTPSTNSSSSGDSIKLAKPNNEINMGDTVSGVFGTTVSDDDLPELLANGVYKNDANTEYDYEQKVTLGNALQLNYFSHSDYQDRKPAIGINLTSPQTVLNYTLDFTTDAESTQTSAGRMTDLETTTLHMLGRDYYIQQALNSTTPKLILLDAANSATAREGEPTTVTVSGKTYTISIDYIDTTKVKLNVNGESTNTLQEGETYRLNDGSYVSVKDILARDIQGAIGQVEFGIGSGKLELTHGSAIKLNGDTVSEITPYITLSSGGSKLDKIVLQWMTDDTAFVTPDQKLVMPGFGALELSMTGFTTPSEEMTSIEDGSSTEMDLKTTIKDGDVTIPFLFSNGSSFSGVGKDSGNRLVTSNNTNEVFFNETRGDEYMVASYNDTNSAETYLLHFAFTTDNGVNRTTISKRSNGNWADVCLDKQPGDTCTLGSLSLTVSQIVRSGSNKWASVNMTSAAGSFRDVYTKEGMRVRLPVEGANSATVGILNVTNSTSSFVIAFQDEDKNDNIAAGNNFNVTVGHQSDGDVEVTTITTGRSTISDPDDSNHQLSRVYDDIAPLVERIGQSSDQRYAQITYSGGESFGEVYLNAPGAVSIGSGNGGTLGGITVTDDQVSTVSGKNMIVVGGSCVNTVAAKLLGSATPVCGADFTAMSGGVGSGQFLIQAFNSPYSSGKVALLVAGYDAQDTINSAKYLTTQTVDTAVGKKYVGTSATQATLVATGA